MEYAVVSVVAFVVATLTLFSGFGLGTLLMPAFALFFPVPVAIAATAVVHLANNLFKVALVGRYADRAVVLRFALPAAAGALAGAAVLEQVARLPPLATYVLGGQMHEVTVLKLAVAVLMVLFALFEMLPALRDMAFDRRYLVVGGLLSGFFGGLTGHQGALRSAFLVRAGLDPQAFIGTSAVVAVVVDLARLVVYGRSSFVLPGQRLAGPVAAATAAAFLGSFLGARVLGRMTVPSMQLAVAGMLVVVAAGLASGLV